MIQPFVIWKGFDLPASGDAVRLLTSRNTLWEKRAPGLAMQNTLCRRACNDRQGEEENHTGYCRFDKTASGLSPQQREIDS